VKQQEEEEEKLNTLLDSPPVINYDRSSNNQQDGNDLLSDLQPVMMIVVKIQMIITALVPIVTIQQMRPQL